MRFLIAIPLFILLVIEWMLDMLSKLVDVVHKCFKDLSIAVDVEYNKLKNNKVEPDSGKV